MPRRQRKSDFEKLVEALARLPWQICLILVPIAYLGFHQLALIEPSAAKNVGQMGGSFSVIIIKTIGLFLQYLAPLALFLGALGSWLGKRRRTTLLAEAEGRTASSALQQLSWREFEQLVGAHFERVGYTISFTPEGADGGVDVVARKGSETFLVQCKQWRATQISVSVVRELFGVMAARGAAGAFVVSIGRFSTDAQAFSEGRNIELVDANSLLARDRSIGGSTANRPSPSAQTEPSTPACPKCGASMVRRMARQGATTGQAFYGCSTYPRCRGTMPVS